MENNYSWFFFRRILKKRTIHKIFRFLTNDLADINQILKKTYSEYDFCEYDNLGNIIKLTKVNLNYIEVGIQIIKKIGDFEQIKHILRIFIGKNNIIIYLEKVYPNEYPEIFASELLSDLLKKLTDKMELYLENKLKMKSIRKYIHISGYHCCMLNCGECCDGSGHTKSALFGGLYCKGMTHVGKFCAYRLFGMEIPVEGHICQDYFCGDMENPFQSDEIPIGCSLKKFIPRYNDKDMEEFFRLMDVKTRGINERHIFDLQQKSLEIDMYWEGINEILEILKGSEKIDKQFYNQLIFYIEQNEFQKAIDFLTNSMGRIDLFLSKIEIKRLNVLFDKLTEWFELYNARKSKYNDVEIHLI